MPILLASTRVAKNVGVKISDKQMNVAKNFLNKINASKRFFNWNSTSY
jgi:hypothetical protein